MTFALVVVPAAFADDIKSGAGAQFAGVVD
jgi:hypothetical protein